MFALDKLQSQEASRGLRHWRQALSVIVLVEFVETMTSKNPPKICDLKPSLHMEYLRFQLGSRKMGMGLDALWSVK